MTSKAKAICLDTVGEIVKVVNAETIREVLDNPLNVTAESPKNHAHVYCPSRGIGLTRDGTKQSSRVTYWFWSLTPANEVHTDNEHGRDVLIGRFLAILKSDRSYTET